MRGELSFMQPRLPTLPRLFLVDGYALIYRAFFALISRPLTTSRGENTSAAWGVVNFLQRLIDTHRPDYVAWVHDSGLSFRHEQYPAYKATREKLGEELQADFDRGMERIEELLAAFNVRVLALEGYEADDVIGTLARQGVDAGVNVVIVSGDKDFYQLVRPGVWLLNPGRGGPASVEEQWVGMENASERLGVPPHHVTDYLAMVGDSSDNIPGVKGIGDKTAIELVATYGTIENILEHVGEITKKRPREALLMHESDARLSKSLVTIREDLEMPLELESLALAEPDHARLRDLFVELEFHGLAKDHAVVAPTVARDTSYVIVNTIPALEALMLRVRSVPYVALGTETVIELGSPQIADPLRSTLVSLSIAVAPGEAYYLPFRHRDRRQAQGDFLVDVSGDRSPTDAPEDRGLTLGGDDPPPPTKKTARKKASRYEGRDQHCCANAFGEHLHGAEPPATHVG